MMKKSLQIIGMGVTAFVLAACQSTSKPFNGTTGFQVESQTENTATIRYTTAGKQNSVKDEHKFQAACQQTLGQNKNYSIQILSSQEIAHPNTISSDQYGRQIGNTNTKFGLSNTPDLYNSDNLGARDALNVSPSTLRVVRYICS